MKDQYYEHKIHTPNEIFRTPSLKQVKPIIRKVIQKSIKSKSINFLREDGLKGEGNVYF